VGDASEGEYGCACCGEDGAAEHVEAGAVGDELAGDSFFEDGTEEDKVGTAGVGPGHFFEGVAGDGNTGNSE
jgi:hypothetical protein